MLIIALLFSFNIEAKLLDKISAVVDDEVYTMSQINRKIENIDARKQISPLIYTEDFKPTPRTIIDKMIHRALIRQHLTVLGHMVGDEQVERQIRLTEERLGLDRRALLRFLDGNNMLFDEYFELIRETIEFNIFHEFVIKPLVSVTDQAIKNEYYRRNRNSKTLSFNFTLVSFFVEGKYVGNNDIPQLPTIFKRFQQTGNLPEKFSTVDVSDLGEIKEDGLAPKIKEAVRDIQEGEFTSAVLMGGSYYVFFVKKKDLVESDDFLRSKDRLAADLFLKTANSMRSVWLEREKHKHYIRYFL